MDRDEIKSYLEKNYKGDGEFLTAKNGEKVRYLLSSISTGQSRGTAQKAIKYQPLKNEDIIQSIRNTRLMLFFGNPNGKSYIPESLNDYIFSIEPFKSESTSYNIPQDSTDGFGKLEADCNAYPDVGIYKVKITGTIVEYNLVMIRVKEDGKEVTKYMDAYLASSDSLTYQDVRYDDTLSDGSDGKSGNGDKPANNDTPVCDWPHNLLIFGAPGTGKSHCITVKIDELGWNENMQRVTFYEDYSYEKFVGAYLPRAGEKTSKITGTNGDNKTVDVTSKTENSIEYSFVPGVFLKMIADAWYDKSHDYVLVIEEINRANAASVFGDFFQLLDRGSDGVSEYSISIPQDMRDYLYDYLMEEKGGKEKSETFKDDLNAWLNDFRLPGNLYLWATMNSADQGVYPMDAAFKRRWSYLYKTTQEQRHKYVYIRWDDKSKWLSWDALKWAINTVMENNGNIEEDRFIGPWFFKDAELEQINAFTKAEPKARINKPDPLTNKLFQYLRQDVFRNNPGQIFKDGYYTMSKIRMGMINGVGLDKILKIDGDNIKIKETVDNKTSEKKISELLKDENPNQTAEQQENKSDEAASQQQENETSGEAAAQQES